MRKINEWIVRKYILAEMQKGYVYEDSEKEKVSYALKTILSETEKLFLLGMLFLYLGRGVEFVLSIVVLFGVRRYTGGFHAKTIWGCFLVSFLYISLGIWISEQIGITEGVGELIYFGSSILIYLTAPLKSENRPVYTSEQRITMKAKGLLWLGVIRIVGMVFQKERLMISILLLQQIEIISKYCLVQCQEVNGYEGKKKRTQSDARING